METIQIRKATVEDTATVVDFDYRLDKVEHVKLNRKEKITKAIFSGECFLILANNTEVGFVLFDYRFFDQGWIELIIIDEACRGKGIGVQAFDLLCKQCTAAKVFTSTNDSNVPMKKALTKAGFTFAGKLIGLDEGDPELFYFSTSTHHKCNQT
jgi:RimJ/RimL family protein N-acetyltransferase